MTNNTDLQQARQELAGAQEKIKSVQARIDKLENNTSGFWVPKIGDKYWFISDGGCVLSDEWDGHIVDSYRLRHNNIFKTESDAQRKLDIETRLFEIAGEVDYGKTLYCIEYYRADETLFEEACKSVQTFGQIVSNDPQFYNKALNQIGETDLKWFYSYGWRRV